MFRGLFLLVNIIKLFVNNCSDLVGLVFVLEHCLR